MIFTSGTKFIGTNYSKKVYRNKLFFNCGSTVKPIQNRGHKRDFRITGTKRSETETSLALHDWLVPSTISTPTKTNKQKLHKTIKFQFKIHKPINFQNLFLRFVCENPKFEKFLALNLWSMASRRRMLLKVIILGDSG